MSSDHFASNEKEYEIENVGTTTDLPMIVVYIVGGIFSLFGIGFLAMMIMNPFGNNLEQSSFLMIWIILVLGALLFCLLGLSFIESFRGKSKYTRYQWGLIKISNDELKFYDSAHAPLTTILPSNIRKVSIVSNILKTFLKQNPISNISQKNITYNIYLDLKDDQKLVFGKSYYRGGIQMGKEIQLLESFFKKHSEIDYSFARRLKSKKIFSRILLLDLVLFLLSVIVYIALFS